MVMPRCVVRDEGTLTDRYGRFVVEPLERGFGATLGNALRRTLLSSIPGAAVVGVRIDGVLHEFSSIPGVAEDVTQIVLNLKELRVRLHSEHRKLLTLQATKKGAVTAAAFETDSDVEIVNPDLLVATLSDGASLKMEVAVDHGRGYVPAERLKEANQPIGYIALDAVFSPVLKVNCIMENTRVEERTDYDRLVLEIWTDGTIRPDDALSTAGGILKDHLVLFIDFEERPPEMPKEAEDQELLRMHDVLHKTVDELELSVRSSNCLRAASIKTLGDLVQKSESDMLKYRNFGRKSLEELKGVLADWGLAFGMKIEQYLKDKTPVQKE
jgi:DNA-directed RNA polymerase subunit alpha